MGRAKKVNATGISAHQQLDESHGALGAQGSSATGTSQDSVNARAGHGQGPPPASSTTAVKKRAQVRHACLHCRSDKVKCSGSHPACSRCTARDLPCAYDVPLEGVTKTQHLRHQFAEQTERLDRVSAIMDIFRNGTDKQAAEALARLRIGESIEQVLDMLSLPPLDPSMLDDIEGMSSGSLG